MTVGIDEGSRLSAWVSPFRPLFTHPTWQRVLVLVEGAVLAPHRRTISAALRAAGKDEDAGFARYHAVLNRCRWSALAASRLLFVLLIDRFAASGPVVIGLDDTIERRWGAKIKARGIYRDPVRSSHGHFVPIKVMRPPNAICRAAARFGPDATLGRTRSACLTIRSGRTGRWTSVVPASLSSQSDPRTDRLRAGWACPATITASPSGAGISTWVPFPTSSSPSHAGGRPAARPSTR